METVRYLIQKTPIGTMMKPNTEGNWVEASDFERVTAERDAIQIRLNAADEENDRLRQLLAKAHPFTDDIAHDTDVWHEIQDELEKRP